MRHERPRDAACDGKDPMTRRQADDVARRMRERGRVNAYHCEHCGMWHVGTPNRMRPPMKGGAR